MKWCFLVSVVLLFALGCGDDQKKSKVKSEYDFYDDVMNTRPEDSQQKKQKKDGDDNRDKKEQDTPTSDGGAEEALFDPVMADEKIELEEIEMEDSDALTALIIERLSRTDKKKVHRLPSA